MPRLPTADDVSTQQSQLADNLLSLTDHFDAFVFDAFGVLNVGQTAIAGAPQCIEQLRALGKLVFVLTNGASSPLDKMSLKFERLGYDFSDSEIVSSRLAAEHAMVRLSTTLPRQYCWGAITGGMSAASDLPVNSKVLDEHPTEVQRAASLYAEVDAFIMLSSLTWDSKQQQVLLNALEQRPRPVVIANPDVVAPHEHGFSLEPGYYAHELLDHLELPLEFHGKPFQSVFTLIRERLDTLAATGGLDVPNSRVAMLGDTLHTDVLGAKAAGWGAILVSDHGLFRDRDVQSFITRSGLVPDWIVPSI